MPRKRVCLAYSGGLDTSVILRWLIEEYGCEVVAYCADVGQEEELSGLPEKAKASGAVDCVVRDVREEFVRDYVFPAIRGAAIYEGTYLLGTALARPLIAKHHVEVARETGCDAARPRRDGQGQRPGALRAHLPGARPRAARHRALARVGPALAHRLHRPTPRSTRIPVTATLKKPYSMDRNLLHMLLRGRGARRPVARPRTRRCS